MLTPMTARVVEALCGFAPRGAGTEGERRAAAWLHDDLRERGNEARVAAVRVRPAWAVPVALAAALAAAGSMVSVSVPGAGIAAGALGALVLALEAAGRTSPLRMLTPRRATQHVLAEAAAPWRDPFADISPGSDAPEPAPPEVTLLICARYDAPRRGLLLNDRWRALGARLRSVRAWLALACALVAACAAARLAGVDSTWLGAVQLVPTLALLVAVAGATDIALSELSPGANDNASGVAVALALHEELGREPPAALEPALLLAGAGASGPESLRAHLRREGIDPASAVVLELGPCGGGSPAWSSRHPQLRRAAERAAAALGAHPRPRGPRPVRAGVPALRVGCLDERGIAPRAHQPDDTPEHVDAAAAEAALDLALGVVDALDAELSARRRAAGALTT
jgi:hypothetical protein